MASGHSSGYFDKVFTKSNSNPVGSNAGTVGFRALRRQKQKATKVTVSTYSRFSGSDETPELT